MVTLDHRVWFLDRPASKVPDLLHDTVVVKMLRTCVRLLLAFSKVLTTPKTFSELCSAHVFC